MNRIKTLINLLKQTFQEWKESKASRLAAGLAYYTIFALAPTVLVILSLLGLFMDRAAVAEMLNAQVAGLVGEAGSGFFQAVVDVALEPKENNLLAAIIGIVVAIIGATGVFIHLKDAINAVWGIEEKRFKGLVGLVRVRAISFAAILALGFMLLVSLLFSTALTALLDRIHLAGDTSFILGLLGNLVSLGLITVVFALMFRFLPDVEVKWRDVWVGAFFTAFLFMLGNFAIGKYLGTSNLGELYGVAGSVLILLTWIYYSAQILLFGAEFTQVYSKTLGTRSLAIDEQGTPAEAAAAKEGAPVAYAAVTEGGTVVPLASPAGIPPTRSTPYLVMDEEARQKQSFWNLILALIIAPFLLVRFLKPGRKK